MTDETPPLDFARLAAPLLAAAAAPPIQRGRSLAAVLKAPLGLDERRWLRPEELARADRLREPWRRARYVAGRAALRQILAAAGGDALGPAIEFSEGGKPRFAPPAPFFFNLSSGRDHIALALSLTGEIGVDLEPVRPVAAEEFPSHLLSPAEAELLAEATTAGALTERFFRIWTRKEALLKRRDAGAAADWSAIDALAERADLKDLPLLLGGRAHHLAVAWPS